MTVNYATGETLADRVLDALDTAPRGMIDGDDAFIGRISTIQWLSERLRCSDSATLNTVHVLRQRGMVMVIDAIDPAVGRRRLFVTGGA